MRRPRRVTRSTAGGRSAPSHRPNRACAGHARDRPSTGSPPMSSGSRRTSPQPSCARAGRHSARARRAGHEDESRRVEMLLAELAPYVDLLAVQRQARRRRPPGCAEVDATRGWRLLVAGSSAGRMPARVIDRGRRQRLGTRVVIAQSWRASDVPAAALRAFRRCRTWSRTRSPRSIRRRSDLSLRVAAHRRRRAHSVSACSSTPRRFSTVLVYWGSRERAAALGVAAGAAGRHASADRSADGRQDAGLGLHARRRHASEVTVTVPLTGHPMLVDFNEGAVVRRRAEQRQRRTAALGGGNHRRVTGGSSSRRTAGAAATSPMRACGSSSGRRLPMPATTSSRRTATSSQRTASSGSSSRSPSTIVSFGRRCRRCRCFSRRRRLRCRCSCASTRATRIGWSVRSASTDFDCYEVRFEPVRDDPTLYRGTVWIDRRTFARIQASGGAGRPARHGDLERRDAALCAGGAVDNQPVFLLQQLDQPADRADGRPQHSDRKERDVLRVSRQRPRASTKRVRRRGAAIASCTRRRRTVCVRT